MAEEDRTKNTKPGVPVKLDAPVHGVVKKYARLYGESQQSFVKRTVTYFLEHNKKEVDERRAEEADRLLNDRPEELL
jgi:hypothetical protein